MMTELIDALDFKFYSHLGDVFCTVTESNINTAFLQSFICVLEVLTKIQKWT